jgi:hypothetical protein
MSMTSAPRCAEKAFGEQRKVFVVCDPQQAAKVLGADMRLNMALPCRISVFTDKGTTKIELIKPVQMLSALSREAAWLLAEWLSVWGGISRRIRRNKRIATRSRCRHALRHDANQTLEIRGRPCALYGASVRRRLAPYESTPCQLDVAICDIKLGRKAPAITGLIYG